MEPSQKRTLVKTLVAQIELEKLTNVDAAKCLNIRGQNL